MTSRKVDVADRVVAFQGYFRVDRYTVRHETFDGGMSEPLVREVFERGHAAAALPYDPVRDEVVLLEQFRVGALAAGQEPWLIEIVAGIIEEGETPEEVIRREMQEEAGLVAQELEAIGPYLMSPGAMSELQHFYCARIDSVDAGGVFGLPDEGEDIRAFAVPASEVEPMLSSGKLRNATAAIALQWFVLNHARLKAQWGG